MKKLFCHLFFVDGDPSTVHMTAGKAILIALLIVFVFFQVCGAASSLSNFFRFYWFKELGYD